MDISLVGRAGLSAVLPVLGACGVQACGMPSALFSTHTGGFGSPVRQNEAAFCQKALQHYARQDISFDAVYIGYLFGDDQFDVAETALQQYPDAFPVVDPAMGDDGKQYTGLSAHTAARMRLLCQKARLITPNFTESALLLAEDPAETGDGPRLAQRRLEALCTQDRAAVITSVPVPGGGFVTMGRDETGHTFTVASQHVPRHYPGTGDSFTAALCGLLVQGVGLQTAAETATKFVQTAAVATFDGGGEARHGLWLEPYLWMLAQRRGTEE